MILRTLLFTAAVVTSTACVAEDFNCASFPDGAYQAVSVENNAVIDDQFIAGLAFQDNDLAAISCTVAANDAQQSDDLIATASNLYYVNTDGKMAQVVNYDNGPDYFRQGLARTIDGETGLIGFIDKELDVVIAAEFKSATPFNDAGAVVSVMDDAGSEMWGIIDTKGGDVVETAHPTKQSAILAFRSP